MTLGSRDQLAALATEGVDHLNKLANRLRRASGDPVAEDEAMREIRRWSEMAALIVNGAVEQADRTTVAPLAKLNTSRQEIRSAAKRMVRESVGTEFNPNGFFVYQLIGANDEVLYVGQSENVMSRIGSRLYDPLKRGAIERVRLVRCLTREDMNKLELTLIAEFCPRWNILGVPADVLVARSQPV